MKMSVETLMNVWEESSPEEFEMFVNGVMAR